MDKKAIGRRIKEIRGNRTQHEYASQLGVKQGYITKYEHGTLPEANTLKKIADTDNISIDWIIAESGAKYRTGEEKIPVEWLDIPLDKDTLKIAKLLLCNKTTREALLELIKEPALAEDLISSLKGISPAQIQALTIVAKQMKKG